MEYDKLSIGELQEVIARAEHAIVERREQDLEALRKEVVRLINGRGFEVEDVFSRLAKVKPKNKVTPIYRDPGNPSNTWTGRGRKPKWVVALIEAGATLESLKI